MKRFLTLVLLLFLSISLVAKTFHFIGFYNTGDRRIGDAIIIDSKAISQYALEISEALQGLGYRSVIRHYADSLCSKKTLMSVLDTLTVDPDDVVLFYYRGHGGRAVNDMDQFPQMCLGSNIQSEFVPVTLVKNIIKSKGGRLAILFSGCCNSESKAISIKPTTFSNLDHGKNRYVTEVCRKLFDEPRGVVVMTSSKAGEYSWSNPLSGGRFVISFMEGWKALKEGRISAKWNEFCGFVREDCIQRFPYHVQHAYYEIDLDGKFYMSQDLAEHYEPLQEMNQSVNRLLDRSLGMDMKARLIKDIQSQFFPAGTSVITLFEDGTTILRYEDAASFLNRLSLSRQISRVSFIRSERNIYYVYEYQ